MRKILANLIISYLSSFIGFIILMLSARLLGAEEFAWVALGIAVGGFVLPLINLGNERTFVRDAVTIDDSLAVEQMIVKCFGMRVTVSVIVTLIIAIGSYLYADELIDVIAIATFSLWVALQGLYPKAWFDYLHQTKRQNFVVLGERFAGLVFIVSVMIFPDLVSTVIFPEYFQMPAIINKVLVSNFFQTPAFVGVGLLIIRLISIIIQVKTWWSVFAQTCFKWQLSLPRPNVGGINFRVTMAVFFNALLVYGNQLILSGNSNKAELAAYGLAFQIVSLIFLFQGIALRLVNRKIANACISRQGILYSTITNGLFLGGGSAILAGGTLMITKYIPMMLDDSRFEMMSEFIPILCIWAVIVGFGQSISQHLLTMKQETFYLVAGMLSGITALSLGFVYVPVYGGVAIAIILLTVHGVSIFLYLLRLIYMIYK